MWVGNRSATLGGGSHQQFRGVEILRAILAQGISGTVTPTEIILAGTSAGAIGAGAHVSYVQDLFPNATVLLVLDSVSPPFNIGVEHVNSRYNITDQHNSTAGGQQGPGQEEPFVVKVGLGGLAGDSFTLSSDPHLHRDP